MFFIIPLILIAGSAGAISWIVRPKIKGLSSENFPEIREDFWHLIFPEFFKIWDKINFPGFKKNALDDYEKFLRRVRILSLKTDNFINKLLERRKARTVKAEFKESSSAKEEKAKRSIFKSKESGLIAEIAKNPKDKNLYKTLGALYFENKMPRDAKEVFEVVLELDPNDSETKNNIYKIEIKS